MKYIPIIIISIIECLKIYFSFDLFYINPIFRENETSLEDKHIEYQRQSSTTIF